MEKLLELTSVSYSYHSLKGKECHHHDNTLAIDLKPILTHSKSFLPLFSIPAHHSESFPKQIDNLN